MKVELIEMPINDASTDDADDRVEYWVKVPVMEFSDKSKAKDAQELLQHAVDAVRAE